jgi:threonine/homoserine/homoserine lactone efflux protein
LGVRPDRGARDRRAGPRHRAGDELASATGFRQGLFSNLGNPKIAVFFTGLLPQFVTPGRAVLEPFLLLGGLFVLMGVVWLIGYALLAARAAAVFSRPRVKAAIDGVTGVVLVGLGLRLALEHR